MPTTDSEAEKKEFAWLIASLGQFSPERRRFIRTLKDARIFAPISQQPLIEQRLSHLIRIAEALISHGGLAAVLLVIATHIADTQKLLEDATSLPQDKRHSIQKQLINDLDATPAQALEIVAHLSLLPEITTSSEHELTT